MRIWTQPITVESLTKNNANSAVPYLGIEFLEVGDDFIRARVPVDRRRFSAKIAFKTVKIGLFECLLELRPNGFGRKQLLN